jgi:hypothetical protein
MQNATMLEKLMQHTKEHQESSAHCNLWAQRSASSKSFQNKSTIITLPSVEEICQF